MFTFVCASTGNDASSEQQRWLLCGWPGRGPSSSQPLWFVQHTVWQVLHHSDKPWFAAVSCQPRPLTTGAAQSRSMPAAGLPERPPAADRASPSHWGCRLQEKEGRREVRAERQAIGYHQVSRLPYEHRTPAWYNQSGWVQNQPREAPGDHQGRGVQSQPRQAARQLPESCSPQEAAVGLRRHQTTWLEHLQRSQKPGLHRLWRASVCVHHDGEQRPVWARRQGGRKQRVAFQQTVEREKLFWKKKKNAERFFFFPLSVKWRSSFALQWLI